MADVGIRSSSRLNEVIVGPNRALSDDNTGIFTYDSFGNHSSGDATEQMQRLAAKEAEACRNTSFSQYVYWLD